jgi:hypothetical protein
MDWPLRHLGMALAAGFGTHAQAAVPAHKALSRLASGLPAAGRFRVARAVFQIPIIDLCYSSPANDIDAAELPAAKFPSKRLRRMLAPNLGTTA